MIMEPGAAYAEDAGLLEKAGRAGDRLLEDLARARRNRA